jgi:hypothetical protein
VNLSCHNIREIREGGEIKFTFDSKVLRRIFEPKKDELTGSGEKYAIRNLLNFAPS